MPSSERQMIREPAPVAAVLPESRVSAEQPGAGVSRIQHHFFGNKVGRALPTNIGAKSMHLAEIF
ncbi:hypothetical protein E4U39_004046 [Claviceps sp. Clav50 group G5]|nr:hypothetical protein E4U39_004046 [Claviceps sp. Clav50 group G5]